MLSIAISFLVKSGKIYFEIVGLFVHYNYSLLALKQLTVIVISCFVTANRGGQHKMYICNQRNYNSLLLIAHSI